jgi:hypothetical protein
MGESQMVAGLAYSVFVALRFPPPLLRLGYHATCSWRFQDLRRLLIEHISTGASTGFPQVHNVGGLMKQNPLLSDESGVHVAARVLGVVWG